MFQIELAEKIIRIHNHYSYVEKICGDYIVDNNLPFQLEVDVPEIFIKDEQNQASFTRSLGYCESICIYRQIAQKFLNHHTMVLHGAVISCEDKGLGFLAKSGTGKSTHVRLWKDLLGEKVTIVNGDKPLIQYKEETGSFLAWGTPWCGKENWGCNRSTVLHALCFLVRGETNQIRKMNSIEVIDKIFHQLLVPEEEELLKKEMDLIEQLLEKVPFYELTCNMEIEAAKVAYHGMMERMGYL